MDVLSVYRKDLTNLLFLVGDNAPVNKSIANLLVIPFIGCASHRFNLACKKYLEPFENNLKKINDLMITLSHIKQAVKLRKKQIWSQSNGMLRWSSTLNDILKSKHLLVKRIQT